MTNIHDPSLAGHYARKQVLSKSRIVAWSHGTRFALARQLVKTSTGKRLLDYGCGDGTFLSMVSDLFPNSVGADVEERQIAECRVRLGALAQLSFISTHEIAHDTYDGMFGIVTCMETLEHCLDDTVEKVLGDLRRLVSADGMVIISVPVETGPTLPLKQAVRRIAGWRRLGDYRYSERYRLLELVRMVFATRRTVFPRVSYVVSQAESAYSCYGHKGFNWRRLRVAVERHFASVETRFSPLGWSAGLLSSQAWFICRPR